jgi:hypothetical protein
MSLQLIYFNAHITCKYLTKRAFIFGGFKKAGYNKN